MSINRKKARRTRRRERQQYKARGEHQLLVKIEDALTSKSSGALTPSGTTTDDLLAVIGDIMAYNLAQFILNAHLIEKPESVVRSNKSFVRVMDSYVISNDSWPHPLNGSKA